MAQAQPPVVPLDGFEEQVRSLGRAVVLFTADWCGYCARFAPVFAEAAARRPGAALVVADISDDDADPRWDRYGIRAVPTVIAFEDGQPVARADAVLGKGIAPREFEALLRAHAPA